MNEVLTSAVTAAIVSGLFGIYLSSSERRKLRGEVLETIYGVEILRWADSAHADFMRGIRKLRAKSLVARADRDKIELYVYLAAISRRVSENDREEGIGPEDYTGMIPSELNSLTKEAADMNVAALWSPLRSKIFEKDRMETAKKDLERYKKKVKSNNQKYPDERPLKIDWDLKI